MNELEERRKAKEVDKTLDSQIDVSHDLMDDLREVIFKYEGKTTAPLVVGVLESLKYEVLFNSVEHYTLD
jgi:hypothetical protein